MVIRAEIFAGIAPSSTSTGMVTSELDHEIPRAEHRLAIIV
jgi:hypothetical protein